MATGIYAGTFDPVHDGHIAFIEEALSFGLERVILLPERRPRRKTAATDFERRVAMLELIVADYPRLEVAIMPDEHFSVKRTLPALYKRFGKDLMLLMGSDVAKRMPVWPDVDELLHTTIMIALRGEDTREDVVAAMQHVNSDIKFVCVTTSKPYATSTAIRNFGGIHDDVTSSKVKLFITGNRLYHL